MFPGMYSTAVQVEMNAHASVAENLEAYGQKHGFLVVLPGWRDRLALRVGKLLITIGLKLTEMSTKNLQYSKDLA